MSEPERDGTSRQDKSERLLAGRYRLGEVLGRGGMGTVWRAKDETLGRTVAVKELRFPSSIEEEEKRRLITRTLREAKAIARIRNNGAVTVFDVVDEDNRPWIVMELIEGKSLAEAIREDGLLSPRRAAEVGLAVLDVLRAAHREGILHRDVKPSNVLISEDGRVVLTDFGIAQVEGDPSITSTGMLVGAPSYISPERARGHKPGPAADFWSLGGLLYASVEGVPPYDKGSAIATLTAVMTEPLEQPKNAGPLENVISGLLVKDPEQRLDEAGARVMLTEVIHAPEPEETEPEPEPMDPTKVVPLPDVPEAPSKKGSSGGGAGGGSGTRPGKASKKGEEAAERLLGAFRSARKSAAASAGAASAAVAGVRGKPVRSTADSEGSAESSGATESAESGSSADSADSAGADSAGSASVGSAESAGSTVSAGSASPTDSKVSSGEGAATPSEKTPRVGEKAEAPAKDSAKAAAGLSSGGANTPAASGTSGAGTSGAGTPSSITPRAPLSDVVSRRTLVIVAVAVALAVLGTILAVVLDGDDDAGAQGDKGGANATASSGANAGSDTKQDVNSGTGTDGGEKPESAAGASGSPTTGGKPSPSPIPSAPSGANGGGGGDSKDIAASTYKAGQGYSIGLPKGWKYKSTSASGDRFAGPDGQQLLIAWTSTPKDDPVADWKNQEQFMGRSQYQRIRIEKVGYRGWNAADWEFTYSGGGTKYRSVDRGFAVNDRLGHALMYTAKASAWRSDLRRDTWQTFTRTFEPKS